MARATAVWLLCNTKLTFEQIARSCGLHLLEIQRLDEGDLQGESPLLNGQLTQEELDRCSEDETAILAFRSPMAQFLPKKKERKYTPLAYRQDRPKAIAWLVKHYPLLSDNKIAKLIATTPKTIQAVRSGTHPLSEDLQAHHPVLLGLCTEEQLKSAVRSLEEASSKSTSPK